VPSAKSSLVSVIWSVSATGLISIAWLVSVISEVAPVELSVRSVRSVLAA